MPDKKPDTSTDTPAAPKSATGSSDTSDTSSSSDDASTGLNLYDRGTPDALRRAIDKLQGVHPGAEALPEKPAETLMPASTSALADDDFDDSDDSDTPDSDESTQPTDDGSTRELDISAPASEASDEAAILSSWDEVDTDTDSTPDDASASDADIVPAAAANLEEPQKTLSNADRTPWTLQQFFNGEIDLDVELSKRFPSMPMMTSVKFRTLGDKSGRRVATTKTQDGSSSLVIDADMKSRAIQLSFTYGSMMTLRYSLINLNDIDRSRWLELMNREQGGLAFLWGPSRWQDDYLICIGRRYFTNLYAFSPNQFESAVRLSPAVIDELLEWLDDIWHSDPDTDSDSDDDTQLLTW
jgi:hypothetical protein